MTHIFYTTVDLLTKMGTGYLKVGKLVDQVGIHFVSFAVAPTLNDGGLRQGQPQSKQSGPQLNLANW